MPDVINKKGIDNAKKLINFNNIDSISSWEFSSEDGNELLGDRLSWNNYGKFHLIEDTGATKNTKARYKFPFGKNGKIYRSGLIAIRTMSAGGRGTTKNERLFLLAGKLLEMLDEKIDRKDHYDVYRFDIMDDTESQLTSSFQKTDEGFLIGQPIVTNVGVFTYRDRKGNIIRELRPPEEVFDEDSMQTLQLIAVTNSHPKELINIDSIKKLQVGMTGDTIRRDSFALSVPLKITDKKTIEDIKNGKTSISCGYKADLEDSNGVWMGVPYDAIQRNIRYNHVAIVDRARAGDLAKMRFDSNNDFLVSDNSVSNENETDKIYIKNDGGKKKMSDNLKKLMLDNVEYLAEKEVINALNSVKNDSLKTKEEFEKYKKDVSEKTIKLEAERDTFKDQAEELKKEMEKNKITDSKIQDEVKQRLALIDNAQKIDIEINDEMNNIEIKKSIIKKLFKSANLDGKDEIYIEARYDSAKELLKEKLDHQAKIENNKKIFSSNLKNDSTDLIDSNIARQKYIIDMENAYKEGEK